MTLPLDTGMLSAVIDVAPTPLWVIESDGTVALANRAAVGVLGYRSIGDVIGAPSHDLLHEWHPDGSRYPSHACPIVQQCGSHTDPTPEWFLTRFGQPIPVSWSTRPLGIGGARLLSFTDVTERLAAEKVSDDERALAEAVESAGATRADLRADLLAHVRTRFRDPEFTPARLAAEFHLSLRTVQQLLAEDGRAPAAEIRRRRVEFADGLIARGASVQAACKASGFADSGTFSRAYRRHFGRSPSTAARRSGSPPA